MSAQSWSDGIAIGMRLKQVRKLLRLKADELGRIGGVSRTVQYSYEKGETLPDAGYLARLAERGADVLYIVTGQCTPVGAVVARVYEREGRAPWLMASRKPHYRLLRDGSLMLVGQRGASA